MVPAPQTSRPAWSAPGLWRVAAGYLAAFLLLDWISYIRPLQGLNITPWNPQPAVAVALLMWDRRWLWLVWVGFIAAELVVRGMPRDLLVSLGATAALTLTCAAIARAIGQKMNRTPVLARRRDLLWLTTISIGGALAAGIIYVSAFSLAGLGPTGALHEAIARYWIGDAVGLLVMLPMLLMLLDRERRADLLLTLRTPQWWLIAGVVGVLSLLVFARADEDHFRSFYLLMIPVVWAAARLGLPGAVLAAALTQLALIAGVQSMPHSDLTVFELQLLMAALTLTALALGVTVDENERAQIELRGSLRMAAAGQMAAALAHELSQPLTALTNYAQASRLLVSSTAAANDAERFARLAEISLRMADDAQRAGAVVKRLREFFRSGSTQLQAIAPDTIVADAIEAQRRHAEALGVQLHTEVVPGLPALLVDPIQIGVVMRNLLANAIEAKPAEPLAAEVHVRAFSTPGGEVRFEVQDNGPGIDEQRLATLFEPGASDKPGGMGLGLSISSAIVEAHEGRLWAQPGTRGLFCMTLPIEAVDAAAAPTHAA